MLTRRSTLTLLGAAPALLLLSRGAQAAEPAIYAEDGIAIDGTDAVAYFTESAPVPGNPAYAFDWMGATWRFMSAANRDAFAAEPQRYAPAYGGYCAFAVSRGSLASTVPHAWQIVDDRLFLNFSRRIHRRWQGELPNIIAQADGNWPSVLG